MVISHVCIASSNIYLQVMNQQEDASLKELNLYFNIMNVKLCLLNQEIGIQLFYQIILLNINIATFYIENTKQYQAVHPLHWTRFNSIQSKLK